MKTNSESKVKNHKSSRVILLADDLHYFHTLAADAVALAQAGRSLVIIVPESLLTTVESSIPATPGVFVSAAKTTGVRSKLRRLQPEWLFMIHSQFRHWNLCETFPEYLPQFLEAIRHLGGVYIAYGFPSFPSAAMAATCYGAKLIYKKIPIPGESYKNHEAMMEYLADAVIPEETPMVELLQKLENNGFLPRQVEINETSAKEHQQNGDIYSAQLRKWFLSLQTGERAKKTKECLKRLDTTIPSGRRGIKVLILLNTPIQYPFFRAGYSQHIYCFSKYSNHDIVYLNLYDFPTPPSGIKYADFDVIIFHTAFLSYRWNINAFTNLIRSPALAPLWKSKAIKAALPQDEYINTDILNEFINTFGVDYVFSVAPESEWKKIYHLVDFNRVKFYRVLTGYLEDSMSPVIEAFESEVDSRSLDIGYRAARVAYWLGRHGQLKWRIADLFHKKATLRALKTDISTDARDTFYGENWHRFLTKCKYFIGVEGGASILCRDNIIRMKSEKYLAAHPNASFEETEKSCFPGMDGYFNLVALSPRHLEACAAKTCQILVEGDYNGILKPGIHYLELKKDFSNIEEVLDTVCHDTLRVKLTERAFRDVVATGQYSYREFVNYIFLTLTGASRLQGVEHLSPVRSLRNYYFADKKTQESISTEMHLKYCLENGLATYRQGKSTESATWFNRLLKETEGDKSFHSLASYYLGEIAQSYNPKQRDRYFRQSIHWIRSKKNKTDYDIYRLASLYKRLNQWAAAKKLFLQLLKKPLQYRYTGGVFFHLGEIYYWEHGYSKAKKMLNRCLYIQPDHMQAKRLLNELDKQTPTICAVKSVDANGLNQKANNHEIIK